VAAFGELAAMYMLAEVVVIGTFAMLYLVMGNGDVSGEKLVTALLLSVRTSTSLANVSLPDESQHKEAALLNVAVGLTVTIAGWVHFLLAAVASALVVARACRPLQQVSWSQRCSLTKDVHHCGSEF
jgi:hypothetical protein